MVNLNLFQICGTTIVLLIVIADVTFTSSGKRLNLSTAIQSSTRSFQRNLRRIIGELIFSFRFLLFTSMAVSAVLVFCLFIGGAFADKQILAKFIWIFPSTLCAGILSTTLSLVAIKGLSFKPHQLYMVPLWFLLWIVSPVLLWLAVMHFGTWLEWRNTNSPLAYASEWFYAEVYDDYFRNPAGLSTTTAIATAICLPIAVPIIFMFSRVIRSITNLRRGVLSLFVIVLFSVTQLIH